MTLPLVTISIPTYNSSKFLQLCLSAIENQTYKNIEINIIDGNSKDNTLDIARQCGVTEVRVCGGGLLQARYEGIKLARGDYVLLLDSDQILAPDTVGRSIRWMEDRALDMLVLEEDVYRCENFIEKLFQCDRRLVHAVKDLDPYTSVLLPRVFRKNLLIDLFRNIPEFLIPKVGGPDHAMIYFEAWKISQKIDMLPKAVKHIEPNSLRVMIPKFYRWGYTSVDAHYEQYDELLNRKERFRKGLFSKGQIKDSLGSILLLLIKGVPYKTGYYVGKMRKLFSRADTNNK